MSGKDRLIVSVSGIRGIVGRGLGEEEVRQFAAAFGTHLGGGAVVLGRDGRPSGDMLRHAALGGLLNAGCSVHDLGIAATPTVGLALRQLYARGAMQITASHNPAEWNGLKLFNATGSVLTAEQGEPIKAIYQTKSFRCLPADQQRGAVTPCRHANDWHQKRILALVDIAQIRAAHIQVFVDANGGAGGPLASELLKSLCCPTTCHACQADGKFQHEPEPIAENLAAIGPLVCRHGAAVGFVLDPDADRLALIDETGRYVGEELTLALAVRFRLPQERGPVVVNMSTSRVVEDIARESGCPFYRSPVGEANVVEKMRQVGAVIGGEGNGGVIDPRVGWVRDPFIGMGLILNLMSETGKNLSTLVDELPTYHIVKAKYPIEPARLTTVFKDFESRWPGARANREDGLRLDWDDSWVHVRPSNTEPVVRVIAEAPEKSKAQELCAEIGSLLTSGV